jgi:hypothetical protein
MIANRIRANTHRMNTHEEDSPSPHSSSVANALRWLTLPFVYMAAMLLGVTIWSALSADVVRLCAPENLWQGGASFALKCRWPLWVYLVKDGCGAAILALCLIALTRIAIPTNKTVWSYFIALVTVPVSAMYLQTRFNASNIAVHYFFIWVVFTAALFASCALCSLADRWRA